MKFKIVCFGIFWAFLFILSLQAEKVAVFEEVGKPGGIAIGNGYIYIKEKTTIYIYNLKDYKFVKKFGKEGEGPGELKISPYGGPMGVFPINDKVYISSLAKLSVYSKTGEFIKENRVSPFDSFFPYGAKYICMSSTPKEKNSKKIVLALFIADKNFIKGKLIYKSDFEIGPNFSLNFPITPFYPGLSGDTLFVIAGIHGFAIDAFDKDGKKIYRIKRKYKQLKIPSDYKDKTLNWFKKSPSYKEYYNYMKERISFKKLYPPIYAMNIDSETIYVLTNKMKGDLRECIIMDLKGKERKRVYLSIPERYGMDFDFVYTIYNNYFYKVAENIDDETWELFKTKIE